MEFNYSDWSIEIEWGRLRPLCLEWKIIDHEISFFWIKLFCQCLRDKTILKTRYLGFLRGERNADFIGTFLNRCIDTINNDGHYFIKERYRNKINQEFLNAVHDHFSVLIGDESFKSKYWKGSNSIVRSAICGLNDYVHELEAWDRANSIPEKPMGYISGEFFEAKSIEIEKSWDHLFNLSGNFGDLCLHYDQIGKTWLEVMIDEDESIKQKDIRILSRLTGSFNINFFDVEEDSILKSITPYAQAKKINLKNKELRLGQCCIAHLCHNNKEDIMERISCNLDLSKIRLKRKGMEFISRDFSVTKERYFYEG